MTAEDDSIAVDEDEEDVDLRFSLDIYNVDRVCIMNEALGQVSGKRKHSHICRVTQQVADLSWVDFDVGCS